MREDNALRGQRPIADMCSWRLYLHGDEQLIPLPTTESSHRVARGLRVLLGKEGALHLRRVIHDTVAKT